MDTVNLVRMANRIGDFFEAMPERDEALEGIADHIRKFWTPAMRRQLLAAMEAGETVDLHDIVRGAVEQRRDLLA